MHHNSYMETKQQPFCLLRMELGDWSSTFNLEKAVCNHGFFMMAPNNWIPSTKSLQRPLHLSNSSSTASILGQCVNVSISRHHQNQNFLIVHVYGKETLSFSEQQTIESQIVRMLKLTEKDENDVREFQNVHPQAKHVGFGRLFRSPSLFEDIVKSILLCNSTWARTLKMAEALCKLNTELNPKSLGNFPSSREMANLDEDLLRERCSLGYRAKYILLFAKKIESGKLNMHDLEEASCCEQLNKILKKNKGFGVFVCANVLLCAGFYQKIPIDTETIRHLQEEYSRKNRSKRKITESVKEIYDKYAPFQCLAYWFELLEVYEKKLGKLSELDKFNYHAVTGSQQIIKRSKSK